MQESHLEIEMYIIYLHIYQNHIHELVFCNYVFWKAFQRSEKIWTLVIKSICCSLWYSLICSK